MGWTAAAAVLGFGALIVQLTSGDRRIRRVLLSGSALTTVLLVDDLFLVHDDILLRALGSERPVLAAYGILTVAWLVSARFDIGRTAALPLVAAMGAFATSVVIDRVWASDDTARLVIEDGAKFVGIGSWLIFVTALTIDLLADSLHSSGNGNTGGSS